MGVQTKILNRTYTAETVTAPDGTTYTVAGKTGALALGVPGTIFDASPARFHTDTLATAADFGTFVSGKGVLVSPREGVLTGTVGEPLAPSLTLAPGDAATFMTFGHVIVYCKDVENIIATGKMTGSVLFGGDNYTKVVATTTDPKGVVYELPASSDIKAWAASTAYAVGDFVTNSSTTYYCTTATTGDETFPSAKFQAVTEPSSLTTLENQTATVVGTVYKSFGTNVCAIELNGFAAAS